MSLETRRLAAVMFTDMAGYTALTQKNESLALSLLEKQTGILLPLIREFGGVPIKTIGDAHLAEFDSALAAVQCAMEIQKKVGEHNVAAPGDQSFKLRIGIHVGDVVHKDNDVFGDAVNIAARLEPLADPGGVCISQQVYDQIQNKVKFRLERLPARQLKNVNSRIDIYRVSEAEEHSFSRVSDEELQLPRERIAVLPLSNYNPSQQDEYLADGMTEELITAISGVQGLRVIARGSVMKFKNAAVDISEISRTLRAGTILEGSFRKVGDRIRVTVQLIDSRTEEHIWASNYDGDMQDIFSIQTDIANKVAQALKVKLLTGSHSKPVNIDAYELYLKGRSLWNRRTREAIIQALKLFRAAVEKDPTFAKAYSGIADCYIVGRQLFLFEKEGDSEAKAAIEKALELDDELAEVHASKGLILNHDFRFSESEEEFKKALALNQSYASAHHWYAICLLDMGRLDEAFQEAILASQADPLAAPSRNILGSIYMYKRQYDKAMEVYSEILKLDPDFRPALSARSTCYAIKGMEKEATRDLDHFLLGTDEFNYNLDKSWLLAWFGKGDEAQKCFEEALKHLPSQSLLPALEADYYGVLGDADKFFKLVGPALESRQLTPGRVRYAPWLDKIRKDPRYADLMKSLPK
jgi:adenylate cyclase